MPTAYCLACDWHRNAGDDEISALSQAMIDHHVETGHSPIEQRDIHPDPTERGDTTRVLYDDYSSRDDRSGPRDGNRRPRSGRF